jgi:hypothetical protein
MLELSFQRETVQINKTIDEQIIYINIKAIFAITSPEK